MIVKNVILRNPDIVLKVLGASEYEDSKSRELLDELLTLSLRAVEGGEDELKEFYKYYDLIFNKIKDEEINPL